MRYVIVECGSRAVTISRSVSKHVDLFFEDPLPRAIPKKASLRLEDGLYAVLIS